jgi:WD40 repeat protein
MTINVTCGCGKQLFLEDAWGGKELLCPACRQRLAVPDPNQAVEIACLDEEDDGGTYAINAADAQLEARLPGQGAAGDLVFRGELGNFYLSRDDAVVNCVAYSPDHVHALAGLGETVHVLNVRSGQKLYRFRHHEETVRCAAFSPDGRLALTGDAEGGLLLWDVASGRPWRWFEGHQGAVRAVAFAPHGHFALSGSADGTASLWEVASGRERARYEDGGGLTSVAYSPDGRLLLTGGTGGRVGLWEIQSGRRLRAWPAAGLGKITCVAFATDGRRALAGGSRPGTGGPPPVGQWDLASGKRLRCFQEPSGSTSTVRCTAFTPDGHQLLAGGGSVMEMDRDGRTEIWFTPVRLWSVAMGTLLRSFKGHMKKKRNLLARMPLATVHCVAVSPDGRRGLSGGDDGRVQVWGLG